MKFKVNKQNIDILEHSMLVSKTINDGSLPGYTAEYVFDEYWEQFQVINAAFKKDGVPVYDTDVPPVIVDGICRIPNAILTSGGTVEFGVFGTKANVNYPTVWSDPVIVDTGCESGTEIPGPTQSEYQRIIQLVEASASSASSAQASASTSASQAATAAQQAAASANSASASASSAANAAASANQSAQLALDAETAANDAHNQAEQSAISAASSAASATEAAQKASNAQASANNASVSADQAASSANDSASYAAEARDNADQAIATANSALITANSKIGEAPIDNKQYARRNGSWEEVSGGGGSSSWSGITGKPFETIGDNLKVVGGALTVDTAQTVEHDNTKPITSGAVYAEVGNINALLSNI